MTLNHAEPALDLPALPRPASTAEAAASVLRSQIADGRMLPGTQLREERIAAALQVSRNTVREAFRLLSHERLVEHALHRGVFVRTMGAEEIREIYRTRRLVEPLGLRAIPSEAGALLALREPLEAASAAAEDDDWAAVGTADIEFHRRVVGACASVHLSGMFEGLLAELRLAFLRLPDRRALHEPFLGRNAKILALLEASDVEGAVSDMEDYLTAAEALLLDAIPAEVRSS
jgi:DNA-binding GntR family transcriptional regulator